MKSTYKNSIRSKQMIRDALISLLEKKSIDEITVTEIVNKAGINRGTFYNHFNNPTDVLEELKTELFTTLTETIRINTEKGNVDSFIDMLADYFAKNEEVYRKIIKGIPQSVINDLKLSFLERVSVYKDKISDIKTQFIVNGMAGICLDYLQGYKNLTLDKMRSELKIILKELVS